MSDDTIKQQFNRWTSEHSKIAQEQGWDMFNYDRRGLLQMQRCDESNIFRNDREALAHVRWLAEAGHPTGILALELEAFFDPIIYPGRYVTAPEDSFELPASVQPQVWVDDHAIDSGEAIHFDAQLAMINLRASLFARYADEILNDRGHDYDDLAINAGVIQEWLDENDEATFLVTVDKQDFVHWLESVGVTELEAVRMTAERLEELRLQVVNGLDAPMRTL